jgi:hypothetical protein
MMMEAPRSSEMSVIKRATGHKIPEYGILREVDGSNSRKNSYTSSCMKVENRVQF